MTFLIIMPNIEDIQYFLSAGHGRETNDAANKIREDIISNMLNIDDDYLNHPVFGIYWSSIREKFVKVLESLCPSEPYKQITITHTGGIKHNFDFIVSWLGQLIEETQQRTLIKEIKLEFKHNNSTISELAQFLELYDKDCKSVYNICEVSYAEHYYDNFLDEYIKMDETITEAKPPKEIYLKHVYDIKYKHPFFKNLHNNKNNKITEKRKLARESISTYLHKYSETFSFTKIEEKIKESQKNKLFLMWDCTNFHIQELNIEKIKIPGIKKDSINDLYFDVNLDNCDEYDIRIRINWGNSQGLCNPRWKFSYKPKT
jgi:hypothetical protein